MSTPATTKIGHGLAKVLGIKLEETRTEPVTRGESVFSVSSADTFVEDEPTVGEWIRSVVPDARGVGRYFYNLFPFIHWITRYNLQWFYGDLVAGITVGAVVVPQSMAYAKLAQLPVEYGLYSSFMGVLIYWFFATSKDITIGPVAVMSQVVGNIILHTNKTLPRAYRGIPVANSLAIICGAIVGFLGFARLGWLVDFISLTAISAFMTGSAINIAVGQVPNLMGITGINNRESTYKVIINILKHLGRTNINAAMGLTALFLLYLIRFTCNQLGKRFPNKRKLFFFLATLRTAFVILLYTMISWLVNRHHRTKPKFSILGKVPRGFQHAEVPTINKRIISAFAKDLPGAVMVLLIEHISISKSFGRINNYVIDPSQELVAISVTNLLGPFLGAYPATGSFSRTAIKSKAGVRTPLAGVITAVVVLLAIYALPAVFFYIPNAGLSAVIIHAVGDLITPPNTVYKFWRISPLEVPIFFAGVFVTIFTNIEYGVYTTISSSAALLFWRIFKARGRFLGRVKIHSVVGDSFDNSEDKKEPLSRTTGTVNGHDDKTATRTVYLPIDHHDGSNPAIEIDTPYPGVFIFRFSEGYTYPNAGHYLDYLTAEIFKRTRRTNPHSFPRLGDRPWNDPGPRRGQPIEEHLDRPTLKAIILDMSSVNNVDVTSVQALIDVRNQLDRYTDPDAVEWHFASINSRWTKRALAAAGFGFPASIETNIDGGYHRWKPIYSVTEIGGDDSPASFQQWEQNRQDHHRNDLDTTVEEGNTYHRRLSQSRQFNEKKIAVVNGVNRPLFHLDITSALHSAIHNIEGRETVSHKAKDIESAEANESS